MRRTILLILPALQQAQDRAFRLIKYSRFPPLSLLTLAGLTPRDGYEVIVRDEHIESSEVTGHVDLVGIQTYVSSANRAYELAALWRGRGAKVVLGGIHPTTLPEEAAAHADAVCLGPAETVWGEILADFERGRLQRFYRGECAGSAALVPLPRRDLRNPRGYLIRNTMVTSRGCPHACDFCYKSSFWGRDYHEARPLAAIERELAEVDDGLVFFLDDNLLADRQHARGLFAVLRGSGILWQAAGSLDVTRTPGYLDEAYAAGCRSLFVGFESLSPETMRRQNKPVNAITDYAEACRRFHEAGIMINGSFVFGFDGDGPDVFARTVEFTERNQLLTATFHILTPFPGTPAFARLEAEGRLLHRDWTLYDTDHAVFRPRHVTPERLEEGHREAYRQFLSCASILKRSTGLPGTLKRLAYNVAWIKVDPLWVAIVRSGLMPFAKRIFRRVLALETRPRTAGAKAPASPQGAAPAGSVRMPPNLAVGCADWPDRGT
jgi:radical SAM superfamily enzyme YgiQ (UPF0313 family)